jgi:hypothetical protein
MQEFLFLLGCLHLCTAECRSSRRDRGKTRWIGERPRKPAQVLLVGLKLDRSLIGSLSFTPKLHEWAPPHAYIIRYSIIFKVTQ